MSRRSTIKINLPENCSQEDLPLFSPFNHFLISPLRIKKLKNAFITNSGFCIVDGKLVEESHHAYPEQYESYLLEAGRYYKMAIDDPNENVVELNDNNTYALIHHPWFNYYHWMYESILRAWKIREIAEEVVIILPAEYQKVDWIMNSLYPFKFSKFYFIPPGKSIVVKNLCLPQIKPICDSYYKSDLLGIRSLYLDSIQNNSKHTEGEWERLYISRSKAARRRVENEAEVESLISEYGIRVIQNEDFDFVRQIQIYSNCGFLMSVHGAGLSNMLFMKPNSIILEMHKRKTNEKDWHSFAFWYLANVLDYKYYHQVCNPTNYLDSFFDANYIVDIPQLKENLEKIFGRLKSKTP